METATIENRADGAQRAIERATAIIAEKGGDIPLAAHSSYDPKFAESAKRCARPSSIRSLRYSMRWSPRAEVIVRFRTSCLCQR